MHQEIKIYDINTKKFNPFDATSEELIANALDAAGLIKPTTFINNESAIELCKSFYDKGNIYRDLTKLGNLLIKNNIITSNQLQRALDYQMENPDLRMGDALINLKFCTGKDIENCLNTQSQLREDIKEFDNFKSKIIEIKERLKNIF